MNGDAGQSPTRYKGRHRSNAGKEKPVAPPKARGAVSQRKYFWFVILLLIGIAVGFAIGFNYKPIGKLVAKVYLSFKLNKSHLSGPEAAKVTKALTPLSTDPNKSVNTLLMGVDVGSGGATMTHCNSDTMMLVCLQERDKKAVIISIPRDTMIELPGHGTQKINAANMYYGPSGAINAVKSLTGIDVNHYITMEFTGFEQIVNAVGGVPIHLNEPINDPHSGYLPAGDLNLDGWQALVLVRSRNMPMADIDRIQSQHAFMEALMTKAASTKSVLKANQIVNIVTSNCKTDYSAGQLMDLAEELRAFKPKDVQMVTIPGAVQYVQSVSYWVANQELVTQMASQVEASNWIPPDLVARFQTPAHTRAAVLNAPYADVITVLSSAGASAPAAATVTQELTLMGHQQVVPGKAPASPQTIVYFRSEAQANAAAILKAMPELAAAQVVQNQQVPTTYNSPIVIILGSNFATPPLIATYGRLMIPAVDFPNMGQMFTSFKK